MNTVELLASFEIEPRELTPGSIPGALIGIVLRTVTPPNLETQKTLPAFYADPAIARDLANGLLLAAQHCEDQARGGSDMPMH